MKSGTSRSVTFDSGRGRRQVVMKRPRVPTAVGILLTGLLALVVVMVAPHSALSQATPPDRVDFQGRLTNASGVPANGSTNFILRLYDASSGGTLLLTDDHSVAGATSNPVTVTNGLYVIQVGAGDITPGSQPNL
ncbi:MAG: hypothetical protein RDV41_07615, partial [Planctomycetota bacterium]|nr:hypothetical protein [Planctomycetota bacterium]